jgi:hypothetical protein
MDRLRKALGWGRTDCACRSCPDGMLLRHFFSCLLLRVMDDVLLLPRSVFGSPLERLLISRPRLTYRRCSLFLCAGLAQGLTTVTTSADSRLVTALRTTIDSRESSSPAHPRPHRPHWTAPAEAGIKETRGAPTGKPQPPRARGRSGIRTRAFALFLGEEYRRRTSPI